MAHGLDGGMNRRAFLQVSSLTALQALGASNIDAQQSKTRSSVLPLIVFMQAGAQSPFEITSPLVDSPADFRGPLGSVQTKNGIRIGEAFPRLASFAHEASIVRSLDCENTSHTARPIFQDKLKASGELLARRGIPYSFAKVPSTFSVHESMNEDDSFQILWNESKNCYEPPSLQPDPRLKSKQEFLSQIDISGIDGPAVLEMEENRRLAFELLLGGSSLDAAFRVGEKQHKRFGNSPIGEASAIASNFAQRGAGLIVIYNEFTTKLGSGWDMHDNLKSRTEELALPTDKALEGLAFEARRGMFVLACLTEHGRTPKMNKSAGRDHHHVGFLIGVGGKFKEGYLHGSVTKSGEIGQDRVPSKEVLPTLLHACGVDQLDAARVDAILKR